VPLVVAWVTEAAEPSTLTLNAVVGAVVGLRVSLYVSVTWAPSLLVAALIKVGACFVQFSQQSRNPGAAAVGVACRVHPRGGLIRPLPDAMAARSSFNPDEARASESSVSLALDCCLH
jgi:hypothetical protein